MTNNNFFNKTKLKAFISLVLACLMCFAVGILSACGEDTTTSTDSTTYSKAEVDEATISNGSFEFGLADLTVSDYPKKSSVTGWGTSSTENSVTKSSVDSGIVDTSEDAWKELMLSFYAKSDYLSALGIDTAAIKDTVKTENSDKSDTEITELVKQRVYENYLKALNPGTHQNASGSHVYMLNNYTESNFYSAQTVTSSSSITLEKNTYGKISFWINTQNITAHGDFGANVRIENSFNSTTQKSYVLSGINTDGWKQYTVYVKADANYETKINVVLSLGYANTKESQSSTANGTVYFDDIVYEEVSKEEFESVSVSDTNKKIFEYASDSNVIQTVNSESTYSFSLDITETAGYQSYLSTYHNDLGTVTSYDFTKSNVDNISSATKFPAQSSKGTITTTTDNIKLQGIENASVKLDFINDFISVSSSEYAIVSFDLKGNVNKFGNQTLTVYSVKGDEYTSVGSYTITDEFTNYVIVLKNNNPDFNAANVEEKCSLCFIAGPTDVAGTNLKADYLSGDIEIANIKFASGKTYQYEKDTNGNVKLDNGQKVETANYDLYTLLSSSANVVTLDDYAADSTDTYTVTYAKSELGNIKNAPVTIKGYTGISYDHAYLSNDSTNHKINERAGTQGDGSNFAGLINSKYTYDNPSYPELNAINVNGALNYSGEKDIQPIMIYNASADAYGFIGDSFTISASSYAVISLKVRVVGSAIANVYLVDAEDADKNVATLSFKQGDTDFSQKLAFENISSTESENDGWRTLKFYIATGSTAKTLRLELWNGSRTGKTKSAGFVFFAFDAFSSDETFTHSVLTEGFTEASKAEDTFTSSGNPLYQAAFEMADQSIRNSCVAYTRELTASEIKYNKEYPDVAISYYSNYVWAKSQSAECNIVYAVYNTIDPVITDPFENVNEDDDESGCTATSDPSTFWLSFSSILLGVVLVFAIIMLVIRTIHRRKVANKSDAKTHYKVTSRYTAPKKTENKTKKNSKATAFEGYEDDDIDSYDQSVENDETEVDKETEKNIDEQLNDYVYGDVEDFGSTDNQNSDNSDKE